MDDKRFDDIIRTKAEGYTDSGHDAHALSDFRRRLDSIGQRKSGFSWGKSGYLLGAMMLFTLINFGIVWYFSEGRYVALNQELSQLQQERASVVPTEAIPSQVPTEATVDTIYVYRNVFTTVEKRPSVSADSEQYRNANQHFAYLNEDQQLSKELEAFLAENNLLLTGEDGGLILQVSSAPVTPINNYVARDHHNSKTPGTPSHLVGVDTYQQPEVRQPRKKKIPNQMLWALEKHNHSGVDFQFGVEGKYHQSNFDVGKGERNGGVGFMTEVIFSPEWRLETGVHFGARAYKINPDEIMELPPSFFESYPGYDDQLGELNSLESDALLVQVPLNLKRFAPLDHNKRWYLSLGFTPQWARTQEFDYKYSVQTTDPPDEIDFLSFVGSKQEVGSSYYTTTVNLGLGTEVYLNESTRWQLGLFYQKGLGDAGYENRQLKSSYGLKSSIWFNKP